MKYGICTRLVAILVLTVTASCHVQARVSQADPVTTSQALALLLSASNASIPESSSCYGSYGQTGKATVKDLLAVQLAYLYSGKNIVQGSCTPKRCSISITHASGEDVSSATIKFGRTHGKADISSLQCVITP
jgi:hypothetical protein